MFFQSLLLSTAILLNIFHKTNSLNISLIAFGSIQIFFWFFYFIKSYIPDYKLIVHLFICWVILLFGPKLLKKFIAELNKPELVTHRISTIEIQSIQDAYNFSKECNTQKIEASCIHIMEMFLDSKISLKALAKELDKLESYALNPFLKQTDLAILRKLRDFLRLCLEDYASNDPIFLNELRESEKQYDAAAEVYRNRLRKKLVKNFIEEDEEEFNQLFQNLLNCEEGRNDLKEYCDLRFTEISLLINLHGKSLIENIDIILYTYFYRNYSCKKQDDINSYIQKKLYPLLKSPDGKRTIIEHLNKWADIDRIYIRKLCDLMDQRDKFNAIEFDQQVTLITNQAELSVETLIKINFS